MIDARTNRVADLLGKTVRVLNPGGISEVTGFVTEHVRYSDGSERFAVQFWRDDKRDTMTCERRELELA